MSGIIWTKFFWSDWEADPALRLCSFAAQGLWMRMLCIAAAHDPIGYVAVAGRPLSEDDLARMTGSSPQEVGALLGELERNGVFSRDRLKRIYSRRMTRDARKAAVSVLNGKKGGNPNLSKEKENKNWDKPQEPIPIPKPKEDRKISLPPPVQPSLLADASYIPPPQGKIPTKEFEAFYASFPRRVGRGDAERAYAKARRTAGAEDILCGAKAYSQACIGSDPKFIAHPATWLNGKRWLDEVHGSASAPNAEQEVSDGLWADRLEAFYHGKKEWDARAGNWNHEKWGPPPSDPGCKATDAARVEYARRFPPRLAK